ncbi:MAG: Gfo/Idh/MocA family oxidoreductase [Planctomycetota bacterium]|nr:Gfo/Idh/MocA family oxidoreductase [Planctomycetota bacterium]
MIRIGLIGAGPNATGHAKYYKENPRVKIVAVADPNQEAGGKLAQDCGAKAVPDYREFLGDVDAVVVSSPNFLHKEHAIACAKAGKHVYCEKPMGLSATEAQEIAAAVNAAGVKSAVGFSVRSSPSIQTMDRYRREGRFGQVLSVWSRRLAYLDPSKLPGWRKDHTKSGGLLLEINVHELEWMMALGGKVDSVFARLVSDKPGPRSNDHVWFTLNFKEGAVGQHEGSWLSAAAAYYRGMHGTRGGATTDEWGSKLYFAELGKNREEVTLDAGFDLRGNFLDGIEKGAALAADVNWGLEVMTVAEAIFESSAKNAVVKIG